MAFSKPTRDIELYSKDRKKDLDFTNKYKAGDAIHEVATILLSHPFQYCRVLIQIGYEPLKPVLKDNFFGGSSYVYPSVFKYISYIKQQDGLIGLFRGCPHRLCSELTKAFLYSNSLDLCRQIDERFDESDGDAANSRPESDSSDDESRFEFVDAQFEKKKVLKFIRRLCCATVAKTVALTISYPFHLWFVRGCSQFIGREHIYDFSWNPFTGLLRMIKEGNLYDGFAPKLYAELLVLWTTASILFTLQASLEPDKISLGYLNALVRFLTSSSMYPLQLTSTVMCVNHCSSLLASKIEPPFYNWNFCYDSLKRRNQLKRGSSFIWRYVANAYKPQLVIRPYLNDD